MRSCFRLAAIVSIVLTAIGTAPPALLAAPPSDAELQSKVDAIAADYLKRPGAAGLSIGVARGGQVIIAKGYGLADVEFDVPADTQTMFRIGSITKQFTAAAIMKMVEQDRIELEDDISKFLPDFPLQGRKVTVTQLLNHTSGIKSYTDLGEEWEKVTPLELTHEQMLALVKDKPFDFEPGSKWAYNNTGYYLLGMIIEKVSGKTYAQYMQEEFFTPLKLERTRYDSSSDIIKNRAQGYTLHDDQLVNDAPLGMSQPYAAGSLLSTGGDLVKWSMLLSSGQVVSPESFALMTSSTVLPDGKDTRYGFGLVMDDFENHSRIQHGGGIFGFNSMLMWFPDDDLSIAVISNGEPINAGKIAREIALAALGVQKTATGDVAITADLMRRIAGQYRFDDAPFWDVKIWEEGGNAMVQASAEGQGPFAILWQGPDVSGGNEFRASFDPEVKMIFAEDGGSFTLFQGDGRMTVKRVKE